MAQFHEFSTESVDAALQAARANQETMAAQSFTGESSLSQTGEMSVLAECIKLSVEDHKVCLSLPLGLGKHCIPIHVNIPNGTAAQACLTICTTWGIPTGAKVSVIVAGITVVSQTFGKC